MEINTILGYLAAVIAGIIMGLIGGGGSILTVPILVYLLGLNPITATAYSLFVVGTTSSVGALQRFKKGLIDLKSALTFALPSITGVYLTRRYIVPILPETMFTIGDFEVTSAVFVMLSFAILMLTASISMIYPKKEQTEITTKKAEGEFNTVVVLILGLLTGVTTGFLGAGGGFLNIPVLVLLIHLPMKKAIGTSLFIIAIKSLIGFLGDLTTIAMDWGFLLSFTGLSIIGIYIGLYASKFIDETKLKKGFGYFTLFMGGYIIWKELL